MHVITLGSGPSTALAFVIEDSASSTVTHVGDTTSTHIEAGLVIWIGIHAIRFAIAETRPWGMGGGSGGGLNSGGAYTRFWCGGRWQWGQL